MPVTIQDIAKRVKLSHTTVSRALNHRNSINIPEPTRLRVIEAANEMGYRPNLNARALVTGRTKLIALQLYRMDSSFAMEVARRMQALAWQDGYEVLVHEFFGNDSNLRSVVDGVLMLDRIYRPEDPLPQTEEQTPHVALGAFAVDTVDYVGVDLKSASLEAMQLLIRSGRKRIAFLGLHDSPPSDARLSAYYSAMEAAGLETQIIAASENTRARFHGYEAVTRFFERNERADAIFCKNDEVAAGCYRALRERGLRIPDDVAVIGCDGMDEGQFLAPPLTTISQPINELCYQGWEFLKLRMQDRSCERQQIVLPASLTLRESH